MTINLPYIEPINTLNLPDDFEEKVKYSFYKFMNGLGIDHIDKEKLFYLDNIRRIYLDRKTPLIEVGKIIGNCVAYDITNNDKYPDKEEFYNFDFMVECYIHGEMDSRFIKEDYDSISSDNDKTLKAIAQIVRIIMNYEQNEFDESDEND